MSMSTPRTLYDKIWQSHLVHEAPGEASVLYIDRHLVHEVTSAQAFEGLREAGRKVRRPELTLAVADHNVPTAGRAQALEGLRAGDLVDEVAVDVDETGAVVLAMHQVALPDLVEQRAGLRHGASASGGSPGQSL